MKHTQIKWYIATTLIIVGVVGRILDFIKTKDHLHRGDLLKTIIFLLIVVFLVIF